MSVDGRRRSVHLVSRCWEAAQGNVLLEANTEGDHLWNNTPTHMRARKELTIIIIETKMTNKTSLSCKPHVAGLNKHPCSGLRAAGGGKPVMCL